MPASADGAKAAAKATATVRQHRKVPEAEVRADQDALTFVTKALGVDAQEIVNIALTWDSYFAWHFQLYTRLAPDADDASIDAHGLSMLHLAAPPPLAAVRQRWRGTGTSVREKRESAGTKAGGEA